MKDLEEKRLTFEEDELEIIRELLSIVACGYERKTFYFDCCEANIIIKKIDDLLVKTEGEQNNGIFT
ncbi:hypothetical protein NSQ82_04550 [Caldifermentibacillus hisashii]|uniref:hypothetical protein n=1 Tax=Caldifermentibacillus hisashii TaxID=996558 RepID=UPI003100D880